MMEENRNILRKQTVLNIKYIINICNNVRI
jgi:hypothetical protein